MEPKNTYNSRPYSSDNKEREPKKIDPFKSKVGNYDALMSTFKSPYENKYVSKTTSNSKIPKKKEEMKSTMTSGYERPQSANIAAERRKRNMVPNTYLSQNTRKEELMITGKKRFPSTKQHD